MDLPCRFQYAPPWSGICKLLATACLITIILHIVAVHAAVWFGAVLVCFVFTLVIRRLFVERFIELRQDSILACRGFLHWQVLEIPYADISSASQTVSGSWSTFTIISKAHRVEINSMFLPKKENYDSIVRHLQLRISKNLPPPPQTAESGQYCFQCSYEGNGTVHDSLGEIIWHVRTEHKSGRRRLRYGIFRLPDFVVLDKSEKELFRFKLQRRRGFLQQFEMLEGTTPVGKIEQHSIFLNRYTMKFVNGRTWKFRMPLFTVYFSGESDQGQSIKVRLWHHTTWYVLIDQKADCPQLVAALAFIHRERLRLN